MKMKKCFVEMKKYFVELKYQAILSRIKVLKHFPKTTPYPRRYVIRFSTLK